MTPLLTEKEVAAQLNIAVKTLQYWRLVGGGIRFIKLGRLVRYDQADVQEYINKNRMEHTS